MRGVQKSVQECRFTTRYEELVGFFGAALGNLGVYHRTIIALNPGTREVFKNDGRGWGALEKSYRTKPVHI